MTPLSCFRPFSGPVERIIGCPSAQLYSSTSRILQNELLNAASTANGNVGETCIEKSAQSAVVVPSANQPAPPRPSKKRSVVLEKSRLIMMKAAGIQSTETTGAEGRAARPSENNDKEQNAGSEGSSSASSTPLASSISVCPP